MSTKEQLLARLERTPGEYVSGEELAAEMGVSRNAVWKAAQSLRDEGHLIDAATRRGYALSRESDRLSTAGIAAHLEHADVFNLAVRRETDSTNSWAREAALKGAPEGTVVIAERQTAGRGRRGRAFFSPEGSGVYLSIVLRPSIEPDQAHLLTCLAAVATARAIERVSGRAAGIKWVNDVYLGDRKVAGILTEGSMSFEDGRFSHAVVGIGINVREPNGGWPQDIAQRAGAILPADDRAAIRCRLVALVLDEFWALYTALPADTFAQEYRNRCIVLGETVTVTAEGSKFCGQAIELDDDYRLVVEKPDGTRCALSFGDVSIRRRDPHADTAPDTNGETR